MQNSHDDARWTTRPIARPLRSDRTACDYVPTSSPPCLVAPWSCARCIRGCGCVAPHRTALTLRHTCRESLDNKEIGRRTGGQAGQDQERASGWNFERVFWRRAVATRDSYRPGDSPLCVDRGMCAMCWSSLPRSETSAARDGRQGNAWYFSSIFAVFHRRGGNLREFE